MFCSPQYHQVTPFSHISRVGLTIRTSARHSSRTLWWKIKQQHSQEKKIWFVIAFYLQVSASTEAPSNGRALRVFLLFFCKFTANDLCMFSWTQFTKQEAHGGTTCCLLGKLWNSFWQLCQLLETVHAAFTSQFARREKTFSVVVFRRKFLKSSGDNQIQIQMK